MMNPKRKLTIREKYLSNSLSVLRRNYEKVIDEMKQAMREERYEIVPDIERTLTSIRNDINIVRDRREIIQKTLSEAG